MSTTPLATGFRPGAKILGSIRVPGSKSIAQRVLVCAGLAQGTTRIAGLSDGGDVRAAAALVAACGAKLERLAPAAVAVSGRPPGPHRGWSTSDPVSAGESGTLARLSTAALALAGHAGQRHEVRAEATLLRRKSPALFAALARADVEVEFLRERDGWPVRLKSIGPPSEVSIETPGSSQEVSALALALAAWPDEIALVVAGAIPSRPYFELTRVVVRRFGAAVEPDEVARGRSVFRVRGAFAAPADPITIEPDASSAAVALAAGCLSGGRVEVRGLPPDSAQPDARAIGLLERFGCRTGGGPEGVWAEGVPSRGADVDASDAPDFAPVLAAVAAAAALNGGGASRIAGLATLAGKESSRIDVLARGLAAVGLDARASADALEIRPPARGAVRCAGALDPKADHRMAFAFALLGLAVDGVRVSDPDCVAKSWPGFWADLERSGARLARD